MPDPDSKTPANGPDTRAFAALIVADDTNRMATIVAGLGRDVACQVLQNSDAGNLILQIKMTQPDILILDCPQMSDETISLVKTIIGDVPLAVLIFAADADRAWSKAALHVGVTSFVVDGLSEHRVRPLVDIALERFRLTDALYEELRRSKNDLADRKQIERAKGLLMERRDLNEREAYDAMRRMAMAQGKTLRAIADSVLSISDIFP